MTAGKKIKGVLPVLLFLATFSHSSAQQGKSRMLSLEDCILLAFKNNLQLGVEIFNPQIAETLVTQAMEKFMPRLAFGHSRQRRNSASYSWIEASEQITSSYIDYSAKITQLFPTGGTLSAALNTYKNETNARFQTINPRFGSTLSFIFTQPLLRDFGLKMNQKEIFIARNNQKISENELINALLKTIYDVEEAYWNLVYSIEILKVKEQSLRLALDLLEKNQKEIEIGTLAPKEILSAQAEVAARKAEILQTESLVRDSSDLLKMLINLPDDECWIEIIPVDKPAFVMNDLSLEEALQILKKNRPDLESSKINLENRMLELSFARNQLLPSLNLNIGYWSPGISGTQILYLDNNPLSGGVVRTIPGGASSAIKDAFNFKYKNWSVSLSFEISLETILTRASAAQAKINYLQAEKQLHSLEQKALWEAKSALAAVRIDYLRVEACRLARELAEKKLEAEEAKLKAGLSTNFVVLLYQRDLAGSRAAELKALIDYNLSLSRLDKALGVSLEKRNIRLTSAS